LALNDCAKEPATFVNASGLLYRSLDPTYDSSTLESFILSTYPQWVLAARLRLSYPGYAVLDSLILFPAKFFVAELTMKG
jgi:hypothetical protein